MTPNAPLPASRAFRVALLAAVVLALTCGTVTAQTPPPGSVALRWNDCYGDGGASARNFACNTNTGVEELVVSAFPPAALPQLNGAEVVITVISLGPTLASWWQFQSGGCRATSDVLASFTAPGSASSCLDPWLNGAAGGVNYAYPFSGPNQARLRTVQAIPGSVPVPASTELFVCRVLIRHTRTVGSGSCAGCQAGACIGLNSVHLTQSGGAGNYVMLSPVPGSASDYVGWQTEVAMTSYTYQLHGGSWLKDFTSCELATESRRPSWGAIKRLYR